MTDEATVKVVDQVLSREINPEVVRAINDLGGQARGFAGTEILKCRRLSLPGADGEAIDIGYVGEVVSVNTESLQQCIHLAKPGGRMILLATYWGGMQIPGFDLCMKEIDVIPAAQYNRLGPSRDVDVAATILATTPIVARSLITHRFPLDAAAEAFAVAADRRAGAIKVVLEP